MGVMLQKKTRSYVVHTLEVLKSVFRASWCFHGWSSSNVGVSASQYEEDRLENSGAKSVSVLKEDLHWESHTQLPVGILLELRFRGRSSRLRHWLFRKHNAPKREEDLLWARTLGGFCFQQQEQFLTMQLRFRAIWDKIRQFRSNKFQVLLVQELLHTIM